MQVSDRLIMNTIEHFGKYDDNPISVAEANDIVLNFTGFAHLILKLDKKRKAVKNEQNQIEN